MRLLLATAIGLLVSVPARAQSDAASVFDFLRLEPSSRAMAMGGAFAAVQTDDVNALFFNPALLTGEMHRTLSLSYLNHLGGLNAGFAAYAMRLPWANVGAGMRYLSWGELQGADASGEDTESFGASSVALTVGASRTPTERLSYGANVHGVLASIEAYGASALAVDAGASYAFPDRQVTLTASVNNVGVTLSSLGDAEDVLPLDVRLGVAKRLRYLPLLVSVSGYDLQNVGETSGNVMRHLALGGEFQFSDAFQVRFGYNHRRHMDLKMKSRLDFAGFGLGFGLRITRFRLDYAFNSWSTLGGLHQVTVRTRL